eukprot:scaffold27_cov18-Tisochrysis_lutea.AAC.1
MQGAGPSRVPPESSQSTDKSVISLITELTVLSVVYSSLVRQPKRDTPLHKPSTKPAGHSLPKASNWEPWIPHTSPS